MTRSLIAVGVLTVGLTSGISSADETLGPPVILKTFVVGEGPMPDVASDPTTQRAYVTSQGDDSLYVVDATGRVGSIAVGPSPRFAAVDSTTQTAYVTTGDSVAVVDIGSGAVTGAVEVGSSPEGAEVDPSTHKLFISNADDDSVSVIDTESRTVTATITVGDRPGKMGVDPTSGLLYVSNTEGARRYRSSTRPPSRHGA